MERKPTKHNTPPEWADRVGKLRHHDGDILAVDYSALNHAELDGKVVVAWHNNKGLCISRFRRYRDVEVLEAENRDYETVTISSNRNWRIIG